LDKDVPIEATTKLLEVLKPLGSEERKRAIRAAMILLGDGQPDATLTGDAQGAETGQLGDLGDLPLRARTWMKQNGISSTQLQQVFHLSKDGAEVIASVPGKSKKEQTYNAYVLVGLGQLLSTGSAMFQDKSARALCESSGCYDSANHSVHLKNRGNEFTGTKDKGWTLTVPGLQRAAEIVKGMSSQDRV
jgi:hypothetical protein